MIITISGLPGSGKSTVGKMLAKRLGYKFYSAGEMRGELAMERGVTIDELNEIGKKEFWTDDKVDQRTRMLGEKEDDFVIDGWVAFHFIPDSFKVFLDVDVRTGAERIMKHRRPDEKEAGSVEELVGILKKRIQETDDRYRKYYDVDFLDKKNFDKVVDTASLTSEQVADEIFRVVEEKSGR